jgi:hypothetical protein
MTGVKLSLALGRTAECPGDAVSNVNWLAMPEDSGMPGQRRPATAPRSPSTPGPRGEIAEHHRGHGERRTPAPHLSGGTGTTGMGGHGGNGGNAFA